MAKQKRKTREKKTKKRQDGGRGALQRRARGYQQLVAEIAQAFDPAATVTEGEWIEGPDGRLDMDVAIRGLLNGKPFLAVIECKDFTRSTTGPVGRAYVDALDSKRHDLKADFALICSNAGFTEDALRKAKRKQIGAISVLKTGDTRVRAVIEETIYLRRIIFGDWRFTYHRPATAGAWPITPSLHLLRYQGHSLDTWLQHRASIIARANPDVSESVHASFRFKQPLVFQASDQSVELVSADVTFKYETQWLAQVVRLDASRGLYDYVRGRVRLAPGESTYIIQGIDWDTAVQTTAPSQRPPEGLGLLPGESDISIIMYEGLATEGKIAPLEPHVVEQDLSLEIPPSSESGDSLNDGDAAQQANEPNQRPGGASL